MFYPFSSFVYNVLCATYVMLFSIFFLNVVYIMQHLFITWKGVVFWLCRTLVHCFVFYVMRNSNLHLSCTHVMTPSQGYIATNYNLHVLGNIASRKHLRARYLRFMLKVCYLKNGFCHYTYRRYTI
jgi:hypothetical protein